MFSGYRAMAAPSLNRVKITAIRAMAIHNVAGNCLIRIDTDSGLMGYGEAGATGPMGTRKIADYAAQFRTPVARHNVGLLGLT